MGAEGARIQLLVFAHYNLPGIILDLNDVQRRAGGYSKSLTLADGEVMNAGMLADDLAVAGDHLAGKCIAVASSGSASLLAEIGFEKTLVVATGDETDLLGVGLFGDSQAMLSREFAHVGLGHAAEREQRAAQLLLCEAEEKVGLVFGSVSGALQQPASAWLVKNDLGIMAGCNLIGANLAGNDQKLVKLQVIVAEACLLYTSRCV